MPSVQVNLIEPRGRVRYARRLVFQLAEVAVTRAILQGVLDRIGQLRPAWPAEEGYSESAGWGPR